MALEQQQYDVSDTESEFEDSNDSEEEDPTFDIVEKTRSSLSKLAIKTHTSKDMSARRNVSKAMEECIEADQDDTIVPPELNEKDQKSYQTIHNIIQAGHIEKLKVDQCKIYLRKHGLRLTGCKHTLIQRIKEHVHILDGHGEDKYPPSSFVLNCKGDACTGDVVMFEQNVYEMFNIASRSATGPPCGTRLVAGRIVKESYGAKKQQHTFTVEVLWSKGEKPLPPLHPLLIKGRNLYRLKTLRQKWSDEAERQKILSAKHARGSVARSNRQARVQEKEMRKMRKENRASTDNKEKREAECKGRSTEQNSTAHSTGKLLHSLSTNSEKKKDQPQVQMAKGHKNEVKEHRNCTIVIQENVISRENWPEERPHQRQPLTNMNLNGPNSYREQRCFSKGIISNPSKSPLRMYNPNTNMQMWRGSSNGAYTNSTSPFRRQNSNAHIPVWRGSSNGGYTNYNTISSPLRGRGHTTYNLSQSRNHNSPQRILHQPASHGWYGERSFQGPCKDKRPCRFYLQGRCYYGHDCRYSHGSEGDWVPFFG